MTYPDYSAFLDAICKTGKGAVDNWLEALLNCEDLRFAAKIDNPSLAITSIANLTKRMWPDSKDIPPEVQASLSMLRVQVKW